ncbi:MAG: ABC transporter ATP-binding protein [Hyphomicrobiaceae bacterium]
MLRVEHLQILNLPPLTFSVAAGECLAVEGPSGSGKTKLLRAIADLDAASGQVLLDGAEKSEMPAHSWRSSVRYIAAEPGWWTDTPRPAFPVEIDDENSSKYKQISSLMQTVGLEMALLDREIARASTGERLRLGLVRALVDDPKVILLDEPTASLDATNAGLVEELIKYLKLSQRCLVLVSHDAGQIDRLADVRLQLAAPTPSQTSDERSKA